ncbi:right-handed parallel beta-helix repeat-containing protein [Halorarius halobius]|uniref:right-handed parallel beta-helix repeat-containing protein n=1 Tax=Halorarius halobius TaxID=2962671 RepID=UPI0020CC2A2A|nr:right-handed parallel beta-helix repeat-containing protein [Halorarius halobius]
MTDRRLRLLTAVASATVLLLSVLVVATLVPSALAETATAPEDIDSCVQINQSGTYQLTGDVRPTHADNLTDDACIVVNSSDVTIDGAGNTLDGSGVDGIHGIEVVNTTDATSSSDPADQLDRVEIRNVEFADWAGPVAFRGVNDSVVTNVVVRETGNGADVYHEYGNGSTISDVTATTGIDDIVVAVVRVDDATISGVTIERTTGKRGAISASYSPDVVVDNVTVDDRSNSEEGRDFGSPAAIKVRDSPRAVVRDTTVVGVDMQGIRLTHDSAGPGNPNALVARNDVTNATDEGIVARRSDGGTIRDNALITTDGVLLDGSTNVGLTDNLVRTDSFVQSGIELLDTTGTTISRNHVDGPVTGIYLPEVDPARLEHNRVSNTSWAIDVEGTSSDTYDGFPIRNVTIEGGDIRLQKYHNVSISNATVTDGRIRVGSHLGDHRNVSVVDTEITDGHEGPSLRVEGARDVRIENVTATDGLDQALRILDSSHVTVTGFAATGQTDSGEESTVRLVWLTEVDNASISGLNVSNNPVDGDDASSFLDGRVVALDVRHTRDSRFHDVDALNNTHGGAAAIRVRGDSANVTLDEVRVSAAESGAVEIQDGPTDVTAEAVTIGANGPANATLSFAASAVVVSSVASPPANPDATAVGRYFDATNLTSDAFLNVSLAYGGTDASGVDESTLSLWEHDGQSWTELQGSSVDTGARTISANVTEFSTFGGFGQAAPSPDPANFAVTIDDTSSPVTEGETLTVTTTVENTGDEQATQTVSLSVDDIERDSQSVTLDGGGSTVVTLEWTTSDGDAGTYGTQVASADDAATTSVEVRSSGGGSSSPSPTPQSPTKTATPSPSPPPSPTVTASPAPPSLTKTATPSPSPTPTVTGTITPVVTRTEVPGFGVGVAVVALLVGALIAARRRP